MEDPKLRETHLHYVQEIDTLAVKKKIFSQRCVSNLYYLNIMLYRTAYSRHFQASKGFM